MCWIILIINKFQTTLTKLTILYW